MSNLQQLRERARGMSGIRLPSIKPNSEIDALINEAYLELAGVTDWPWAYIEQFTAVPADTAEIALDTAMRTVEGAKFDGRRLRNTTLASVDVARMLDEPGDTYAYARLDSTRILLVPPPTDDGELRIHGYRQVDPLMQDSDEPVFDSEFHHVLAYAAAARMLIEEGDDSGRANAYGQEVQGVLAGMRTRYLVSHEKDVIQVGGRVHNRPRWRLR